MTGLWAYSFPEVITPMMPCSVVYFKGDFKNELYGVILKHQSVAQLESNNGLKRHVTSTGLVMYVQREPTQAEQKEDEENKKFLKTEPVFDSLKKLFSW